MACEIAVLRRISSTSRASMSSISSRSSSIPSWLSGTGTSSGVPLASMAGSVMVDLVRRCTGSVLAVGCGAVRALVMMILLAPGPRARDTKNAPGLVDLGASSWAGGSASDGHRDPVPIEKLRPRGNAARIGEAGHDPSRTHPVSPAPAVPPPAHLPVDHERHALHAAP